jgi:uncharacterized protein (DUF2249 family)/hemerythrin-like domain-containing protein
MEMTTRTSVVEAMHNHHQELLQAISAQVAAISNGDAAADPDAFVAILKNDLLPHARGEEAYLYPAVDPLVKAHGAATATMIVDHEFLSDYVNQIEAAALAVRAAGADDEAGRKAAWATLQRLGVQTEAIFALHLEKEERVYLPLFEQYLSDAEQQRILDGMHEGSPAGAEEQALDVRTVPPRGRHELIFHTFEALKPSEAFVLVNDHDPKPLYYQFQAENAGRFSWDYLEQGPEVWRVRIGAV